MKRRILIFEDSSFSQINTIEIMQYGLIGKNLSHSFSKKYFEKKFDKSLSYDLIEIEEDAFGTDFQKILSVYNGLNVTIPYKQKVMNYLDAISDEATEIGAVNCILTENGKKIGHNTDVYGFWRSLVENTEVCHIKTAMVMGTGGSAKAVCYALKNWGNIKIIPISRNPKLGIKYSQITPKMLQDTDLIVNCTPDGMYPNTENPSIFPTHLFLEKHIVYDLIYNPAQTKLLRDAEKVGAKTINGQKMLEYQAEKSYELWKLG